jgi:hypothetical protein
VQSKTPPFLEATRIESQVANQVATRWSLRVRRPQPAHPRQQVQDDADVQQIERHTEWEPGQSTGTAWL